MNFKHSDYNLHKSTIIASEYHFVGTKSSLISTFKARAISRNLFNEGWLSLLQIRAIELGLILILLASSFC